MPYLFYGPNVRGNFLCYFFDMDTPIKFVIDVHSKWFCTCCDLANPKGINCKCLPRFKKHEFGVRLLFAFSQLSTFLNANYLENMHGHPYCLLWIPIALAKIYFFHMALT